MSVPVQWMSPNPFWSEALSQGKSARQPVLLRFTSDRFMDELIALLATQPGKLKEQVAKAESFQEPPMGAATDWPSPAPSMLKLYQPAHGHFYMVTSSLVCRKPGLPDHTVDVTNTEKVSFVLRRLNTDATGKVTEYGWRTDGSGWGALTDSLTLLEGEERLPMFPLPFQSEKPENQPRRLYAGFVPVSSSEAAKASAALSPVVTTPTEDPRPDDVRQRVIDPFVSLKASLTDYGEPTRTLDREADVAATLFLLLDLADLIQSLAPNVWSAIQSGAGAGLTGADKILYDNLTNYYIAITYTDGSTSGAPWRTALLSAWNDRTALYAGTSTLRYNARQNPMPAESTGLEKWLKDIYTGTPLPTYSVDALPVPKLDLFNLQDRYILRCVYERPKCARDTVLVSPESVPFQLASFFDPDAPSRPIRISLPMDTSIGGLRKFRKNVAFLMSPKLREQMERITADTLREGKLGGGAPFDIGHICSLSIPIITLCAFILLFIIVIVLNIVFWWLPFFKICFPIKKPQ